MRRFVCCLGALGLLVGSGLALPGVASATNCDPLTAGGVVLGYSISESTSFQVSTVNPESFACILPSTLSLAPDLFDLYNGPVANGIVSDNVIISVGPNQPNTVSLVSDPSTIEGGLSSLATNPNNKVVEQPCPNNTTGQECDFAILTLRDSFGNGVATLAVLSDTPTQFGGIPEGSGPSLTKVVPEPSTGLLLGAALPALLGIRRRSKRMRP